jgi:putative transcription factor
VLQLRCEVCGRKIYGKSHTAIIESAKLTVCDACSKHGKIVIERRNTKTFLPRRNIPKRRLTTRSSQKTNDKLAMEINFQLIENFGSTIRKARRKLGFSQEELGNKINEKVSVIKKVETEKMVPDNKLATKLKRALKIDLLISTPEEKASKEKITRVKKGPRTLGELIQIEANEMEEKSGREQ